ncbi:MAG: hypothetical protein ABSG81_04375 [Acidimicrobiales bacterium]|jgi:uncharacterized membrane protein YqjE
MPRTEPELDRAAIRHGNGRIRPLAYAAAVLAVFVTTVIVLAVQAGTDAAMLTTLFAIVIAGTVCGLWGTAMAIRETHPEFHRARELAEHPRTHAP